MNINYSKLKLINYSAAGNITPVLDISNVPGIYNYSYDAVRAELENDSRFRGWLQSQGRLAGADSVMIYYKSNTPDYDYFSFVGEPGASLDSEFSNMCGNGVRSLALHILNIAEPGLRERYLDEGISFWFGDLKRVNINEFIENVSAVVEVDMGRFQNSSMTLKRYIDPNHFKIIGSEIFNDTHLHEEYYGLPAASYGYGFNGEEDGEPHLVSVLSEEEFNAARMRHEINGDNMMDSIRRLVCKIGNKLTFDFEKFPLGINYSIGIISEGKVYMSTHERNLVPSCEICSHQIGESGICHCNTQACGTAGAVLINVAFRKGLVGADRIKTIHPGGGIVYEVLNNSRTSMYGGAKVLM